MRAFRAKFDCFLHSRICARISDDAMSAACEACCHVQSHLAQTDHCEFHNVSLYSYCSQRRPPRSIPEGGGALVSPPGTAACAELSFTIFSCYLLRQFTCCIVINQPDQFTSLGVNALCGI